MTKADIKVGFSCNNNCRFCVQGKKRKKFSDKSTEKIKDILEEASEKHNGVVFTGGEPTIRDDLPRLVAYADKLGFKQIQIQTNGRRFAYKDFCKKLIEAGANDFGPALHGPNAKIHDYLTRAEGSFDQTVQGIKNLLNLGERVGTNTVITKPNYKKLPEIAELLVSLGVSQFQFAFIHINPTIASDQERIEAIVPRKSDVMPYVKEGLQIGIDAGLNVMTEAIPFCFMEGYEDYIAERRIPDATVYDAEWKIENFEDHRKKEGKAQADKCEKCKYFEICEGPWREYPEIFGWDEFEPIEEDGE